MIPEICRQRLLQIADWIETHPFYYNQDVWGDLEFETDDNGKPTSKEPACGTEGCIAGIAVFLFMNELPHDHFGRLHGHEAKRFGRVRYVTSVRESAQLLLGLNDVQTSLLFDEWVRDWRIKLDQTKADRDYEAAAKLGAAYIRYFLATN